MKKCVVALCVVIFLVVMLPTNAFGQAVYGSIFGTISDPSGAAVPNAKVTVTDVAKGTKVETTTNATGNYSVTHLVPDNYSIRVEAQGFKASEQKSVAVLVDAAS